MEYNKQLRGRKGKGQAFDLAFHGGVVWAIIYSNSFVPQFSIQIALPVTFACHRYECQA